MSVRAEPESPPRRGARRRGDAADHFRLLADYAPVMIWVAGPDRQSVYFNQPWLAFTGRPMDAELGLGWLAGVHPEDRDRVVATYADAFSRRAPFETEYRLRRHDGEFRWLLDKGVPLVSDDELGGFIGSCVDLTDRLKAEQAARKREQDFKTLAENLPDVIARLDRERRCVYVNPAVEPAFGVRPEDLTGKHPAQTRLPGNLVEALEPAASRALERGEEQSFHFHAEAAGRKRHFEGRVIPERDAHGAVEALLVITYDVTARALEDERRAEILARERHARAHAESANLARDQFLAIVSHELRSPLNGIKSWTHVLENQLRDADPTVRRALKGIMIGVEHQVRLIEDLLDVTRAMSGNLGLMKQPMALLPVLAEAVESLRATAIEKGLALTTDYAIGDREIHGDPDRVRQVFVNLVMNAIKFTPAGGRIHVSATQDGAMGRVEVRDNGAGITPEFLPFVFDPFRQAADTAGSSRRSQEGLGLGLALVQRLVELHGGRVACESGGPDQGATFRVDFPLRRESGPRVVVGPTEDEIASALPSLNGIRVMLIDDQREARESLAALLAQAGAAVTTAASCHEALAHLAIADDTGEPEVLVCDIAMPGEDGYETLRRIRAWESTRPPASRRRRPAVAVSAFAQREDRIRALSEGFQMHLTKPVAPAELVIVISSVAKGMRI